MNRNLIFELLANGVKATNASSDIYSLSYDYETGKLFLNVTMRCAIEIDLDKLIKPDANAECKGC